MYSHSGLVWEPKIPPGSRPFPRDGLPHGIVTRAKLARHLEVRAAGLGSPSLRFSPGRSFPTSTARARLPRPRHREGRDGRDGRETSQRHLRRPPCASASELRHPPSAATPPPCAAAPPPLDLPVDLQPLGLPVDLQPLGLPVDLQPRLRLVRLYLVFLLGACEFYPSFRYGCSIA